KASRQTRYKFQLGYSCGHSVIGLRRACPHVSPVANEPAGARPVPQAAGLRYRGLTHNLERPMNARAKIDVGHSVCPHDCPSTCALDVELLGNNKIGRVQGARDNSYTAGVVCAKVARYAERIHHPDRLMHPLRRKGPKGSGQFERVSWDDAL